MSEEATNVVETPPASDPMLAGLDADLNAKLQEELKHLEIPVQPTNAAGIGETPPGETAGEKPNEPTPPGTEPPPAGSGPDDPAKRKRNAVRYAKMNDITMSTVLSMVKNIQASQLRADNDELANLVDAWEDFLLENQDFKIPGYVQLIIANAVIYGIKAFGPDLMNFATGGKKKEAETTQQQPQRPQPTQQGNPPPPPAPAQPEVQIIRTAEGSESRPQRSRETEIVPYVEVPNKAANICQLPGCDKEVKRKRKFCCHRHSTMWNNYKLRGIPIDEKKI